MVGAFAVVIFLIVQPTIHDSILKLIVMTLVTISLWYLGAALKFLIRKDRPVDRNDNLKLRDRYTFPSMHALTISSASVYIYMHNFLFGLVMFSISFIIMYSRVRTKMHYITDVIGGFLIGITLTLIFAPLFEKYVSVLLSIYNL